MAIGLIVSIVSLAYITYVYALWVSHEKKDYNYTGKFSVIIPCFNEGYKELIECVSSCMEANGDKEVILVSNNSNKRETFEAIKLLKEKYPDLKILSQPKQGKRFAHAKGLAYSHNDIICFVDSDTIVEKDSFLELIKPFSDETVGGSCGEAKVANRTKNILTRSISAMFWTSFNIHRKATATTGYMQVASGCISSYRKEDLLKLEYDYLNQTFLGRPCSISDDRYLTTRIQTVLNKTMAYQEKAVCYTYVPEEPIKAWKMIERWRRGANRELILMWKNPKLNLHFIDSQLNLLIVTAIALLKPYFLFMFFTSLSPMYLLLYFAHFFLIILLYSSIMIVENPKELLYKFTWALMYEFFFIFTFFPGLFRIRNQGAWSTR